MAKSDSLKCVFTSLETLMRIGPSSQYRDVNASHISDESGQIDDDDEDEEQQMCPRNEMEDVDEEVEDRSAETSCDLGEEAEEEKDAEEHEDEKEDEEAEEEQSNEK